MSKILVTGATGFVGRSLVPALIQAGHEVRCAVTKKVDWLKSDQIVTQRLELQADWSESLEGVEVLIHLAARVHIMNDNSKSPLEEYCKVNSIATKNLAEQAAKNKVKRFVFLSSIKVNGEFTIEGAPFTEESIAQTDDPYGLSKLYAEQYLQEISQQTGMEVVILRPPLVYGPGVKANFLKMMNLVNKKWPLPFGNINNRRSFVYIDNLVSALGQAAINDKAGNQVFLVADNEAWSLTFLLETISNEMGVKSRLISIPNWFLLPLFKLLRLNNLRTRLFSSLEVSNNKIKSKLDWNPPFTAKEGLISTIQWFQNENN